MKPITKQLVTATFILTLVTVLSFGIRQIRFSTHRVNKENTAIADTGKSAAAARSSNAEEKYQSGQPLGTSTEPGYYPSESNTADAVREYYPDGLRTAGAETDQEHADVSNANKNASDDAYSKTESLKGEYAKYESLEGVKVIPPGDNVNIYFKGEDELWYVDEQPDGSTAKIQLQAGDITGDITIVNNGKED